MTDSDRHREVRDVEGIKPLVVVVGIGVTAFVLMYIGVAGTIAVDHQLEEPGNLIEIQVGEGVLDSEGPSQETLWSWGAYAGHFTPLEVSDPINGGVNTANPLNDLLTTLPVWIIYLIPISVLIPAGYLTTRYFNTYSESLPIALTGSMLLVAGYTPAMGVLAVYSSWSMDFFVGEIAYQVPLMKGVVVGGVILPIAYSAVGGAIARGVYLSNTVPENTDESD